MGSISNAFSSVTSVIGASRAGSASDKADEDARAAEANAAAADKAKLDFEKEKYQDWQDTYGGIEDNLSAYYQGLSPDYYATQGLEAFEKEQNLALTSVRENLAQRGIADSGIAGATELAFATSGAERRATIRAEAPAQVAGQRMSFLQTGLSLNPGDSMSRALAGSASQAQGVADRAIGRATTSRAAYEKSLGEAAETVGGGLSSYFGD